MNRQAPLYLEAFDAYLRFFNEHSSERTTNLTAVIDEAIKNKASSMWWWESSDLFGKILASCIAGSTILIEKNDELKSENEKLKAENKKLKSENEKLQSEKT